MYTGYFAKLKTYKEKGLIPVSICGEAPNWYEGDQFKIFASKKTFFIEWKYGNHKGDNEYYISHFNTEVLSILDYEKTIESLQKFGNLDNIILLCYESPKNFCHRHLVANWLTEHGTECREYEV